MFSSKNSLLDVWLGTEYPSGKKAFYGFNIPFSFNQIRYLIKKKIKNVLSAKLHENWSIFQFWNQICPNL